jgi:hypothetical protein
MAVKGLLEWQYYPLHLRGDTLRSSHCFHMRILIQNATDNSYFDGQKWDSSLERALCFENTAQAEQCCAEHHLGDALITVKFNDKDSDIQFPVSGKNILNHNS